MASLYGPIYAEVWRSSLVLPGRNDLLDTFSFELSEHYGISCVEASRLMERTWYRRSEIRSSAISASQDAATLVSYYAQADHVLLTSLYWHTLIPDRYALHSVAALHAIEQFAEGRRVLEFGHGVGSTGILLARHGFEVTLGDISEPCREFAQKRLARRGLSAEFVDLTSYRPIENSFDAIVSLDVLEHIREPLPVIRNLWSALRPGGVLVLNIAFGRDPENPEHIQPWRTGVLNRVRQLGFERIPSASLLVFYKRALGRTRKSAYFIQDTIHSLVSDLCQIAPRFRRLLSVYSPPALK